MGSSLLSLWLAADVGGTETLYLQTAAELQGWLSDETLGPEPPEPTNQSGR
jgi:hypothetical protein